MKMPALCTSCCCGGRAHPEAASSAKQRARTSHAAAQAVAPRVQSEMAHRRTGFRKIGIPRHTACIFLLRLPSLNPPSLPGRQPSAVEDRHPNPPQPATMSDAEEEQPVAEVEAEEPAAEVEADEEAPAAAAPSEPMDVNTAVQVGIGAVLASGGSHMFAVLTPSLPRSHWDRPHAAPCAERRRFRFGAPSLDTTCRDHNDAFGSVSGRGTPAQAVLKKALAYDGLARGLHEAARAIERDEAKVWLRQPSLNIAVQSARSAERTVRQAATENAVELGIEHVTAVHITVVIVRLAASIFPVAFAKGRS